MNSRPWVPISLRNSTCDKIKLTDDSPTGPKLLSPSVEYLLDYLARKWLALQGSKQEYEKIETYREL